MMIARRRVFSKTNSHNFFVDLFPNRVKHFAREGLLYVLEQLIFFEPDMGTEERYEFE